MLGVEVEVEVDVDVDVDFGFDTTVLVEFGWLLLEEGCVKQLSYSYGNGVEWCDTKTPRSGLTQSSLTVTVTPYP
jgi:hypothetical protein